MKLYLQSIAESTKLNEDILQKIDIDFEKFSENKSLYDYQQKAVINAFKILTLFYDELKGDKQQFYNHYQYNGLLENLNINIQKLSIKRIIENFDEFSTENDKLPFSSIINRMSFWMATGSGKTLVIIKLIEQLHKLKEEKIIPNNEILFLTYREDLIQQFINHAREFTCLKINLYSLKDYASVKNASRMKFNNEIDVFYYRSDLLSDEQKDKIIDFRNYDNNGKWYILLDEAHKGDREDSKRQMIYSILSRNGFLFNFSATFTDTVDFVTCAYNFNLAEFIKKGYGKHIIISKRDISALETQSDIAEKEKQKIITKIFLLNTFINEHRRQLSNTYYHKPLILSLVNSVNTEDSDLELFFKEIEKFASGNIDENIFNDSKNDLFNELISDNFAIEFEESTFKELYNNEEELKNKINSLSKESILQAVFNAKEFGKIEAIKLPSNQQELILKLKTTDKPFALIKIGDISPWIKNKLSSYEIIERFENESEFQNLNEDDSDITILMGSRAFYEGWDSNRPNIILYINIGKGIDAKKFVLQSIGRGVRIQPKNNFRQRALELYNKKIIDINEYESIKSYITPIETLFVFGTKSENLKEVIAAINNVKQQEEIGYLFEINPDIDGKPLLIPVYKEVNTIIADATDIIKFEIHSNDFIVTREYFNYIGDKISLMKLECSPKILRKLREEIFSNDSKYFLSNNSIMEIGKPYVILKNIYSHFSRKLVGHDYFKKLENEIIHFKHINIKPSYINRIKDEIEKVKKFSNKQQEEELLKIKLRENKIDIDTYTNKIRELENNYVKESKVEYEGSKKINVKFIAQHYYIPVILNEEEKEIIIQHVIKHRSEIDFINELEKYLQIENNIFKQFDWWFFSKIDETLDEIYIPYYNPRANRIDKFKPDFIFWAKKDDKYLILFVDPKGTEHTDGYRKIDGYSRIFEIENKGKKISRDFLYNGFTVSVKLLLKPAKGSIAFVPESKRNYWFDNFNDFANMIKLYKK